MPFFEVELQSGSVQTVVLSATSAAAAAMDAERNFKWSHQGVLYPGEVLSIRKLGLDGLEEVSQARQVLAAIDDEGWYDARLDFLPWSFYREQLPEGQEETAIEVMIKAWNGEGFRKLSHDPDDVSSVHVIQMEEICWVLTTNNDMAVVEVESLTPGID